MNSTFDQIKNSQVEGEPQERFEPISGCPECRQTTAFLMVGRQRIEFCKEHQVFWYGPLNPCSPQFAEIEAGFAKRDAEQREEWTTNNLDTYKQVQPWFAGQVATA